MIASRFLFATLLAASSLTACIDTGDVEEYGEASSELSSSSWTGNTYVMTDLGYPPAMAMLDGFEYYVYGYEPGGHINPWASTHDLWWHQCSADACTEPKQISGQQSMDRVSLAAYNGYIYMVHQGDSDGSAVWFSRLDVTTGQWIPNIKLPFQTFGGSPALAVFNNRLYMVGSYEAEVERNGVTVTTYPLWYATMGTNEQWSSMVKINRESASPPSLAVLGNTIYLAHRNGANAEIVLQKMSVGTGWSAPVKIPAGPSGSYIEGDDVQLAAVNGYLHLVHHRFSGGYTYWTYNRGCDAFAPEVTVDAYSSSSRSSMATGIRGLVLNRMYNYSVTGWYSDLDWLKDRYIAPLAPMTAPNCGAI